MYVAKECAVFQNKEAFHTFFKTPPRIEPIVIKPFHPKEGA
jgi:hypothetical protein